jgi:hypothetical protein
MKGLIVVVAAILVGAVGCGKSKNAVPAEQAGHAPTGEQTAAEQETAQGARQTAQGARQMAEGMGQMARGLQQMAKAAAKPVDTEELKALLPDLGGWTRGTPKGSQASAPIPYSKAETTYTNGAGSIDMDITDTALSQVFLAPLSMFMAAGYEEKSDDGYRKAVSIAGSPGFEQWDSTSKTAEVTLIVANRFVVHAKGEGLGTIDPVKRAIEAVNLSRLASLK